MHTKSTVSLLSACRTSMSPPALLLSKSTPWFAIVANNANEPNDPRITTAASNRATNETHNKTLHPLRSAAATMASTTLSLSLTGLEDDEQAKALKLRQGLYTKPGGTPGKLPGDPAGTLGKPGEPPSARTWAPGARREGRGVARGKGGRADIGA